MRLPQYLAQSPVQGARARYAQAPAGGLESIGQSGDKLAEAFARLAEAEHVKRRYLGRLEAGAAETALERDLALFETDLKVTERDPDTYRSTMERRARQRAEVATQGLTTEEGKTVFASRLAKILADADVKARVHANSLWVDRVVGLREQALADLVQRAALTPVGEQDEFDAILRTGRAIIRNVDPQQAGERDRLYGSPVLGEKEAGESERKFVDQVTTEQARRHRDFHPEHFVEVADRKYPAMNAQRRDEWKRVAETRIETARKAEDKAYETYYERLQKASELQRGIELTELSELAGRGALTVDAVMRARDEGVIQGRVELEHYQTLATAPPRDAPSDPAIKMQVWSSVYGTDKTYDEARIKALMTSHRLGGPGLSAIDGGTALTQLRLRSREATSDAERTEDRRRTLLNESYVRARDEGFRQLGLSSPNAISLLQGPKLGLVAAFEQLFNARVFDAAGNVAHPARSILYEILPQFLAQQSVDAKLDYSNRAGLIAAELKTKVPDLLDPSDKLGQWKLWFDAQWTAVEALKSTSPNVYEYRRQQLLELTRERDEWLEIRRKLDETKAQGKPKTTYKRPVEKP